MDVTDGTPLAGLPAWSAQLVEKLTGQWITTAEQVVALAATTAGLAALARQLEVTPNKARQLVAAARSALPAGKAAQLGQPIDTSGYGRGALPPEEHG